MELIESLPMWVMVLYVSMMIGFVLFIIVAYYLKKKAKKYQDPNNIAALLNKYPIDSDADAFKVINDLKIPIEDRKKMAQLLELKKNLNK